jgi:hypothetical protein
MGISLDLRYYVKEFDCECIFSSAESGGNIEFVIPYGGVLERFVQKSDGVHHLAIEVASLSQVMEEKQSVGVRFIHSNPVVAGPFLVNFVNPMYNRGVLVEFLEIVKP